MKVRVGSLQFKIRPGVIFAQILALFGFALLTSFEARAEIIEGTFRYERNDEIQSKRPIAFAKVEIWRYAPRALGIWAWGHDGDATTDSTGRISKNMPFVQSGVIYAVRVFATNYAAIVWKKDTVGQSFYREPGPEGSPVHKTVNSPSDVLPFDFDFTDEPSKIHYNLAETARHGYNYAATHQDSTDGDQIGQVNIQPQTIPLTYYSPVNRTINIDNRFLFEDLCVLHEYGHYLEDKLSNFFPMPAVHNGCQAVIGGQLVNSPEHAWMEGFADYFAQVVARSLPFGTVTGEDGTFSVSQLEVPFECDVTTGDAIEIFVAASLWDLIDGIGNENFEPWDFISQQEDKVFKIFDIELDQIGRAPTIWDFLNAWAGRGFDLAAFNRILSHNRITSALPDKTSQCLQMMAPTLMLPGQTYNVTVVMRNTGITKWRISENYLLGSQNPQDNQIFQRSRVPLLYDVPPGGQVPFNFTVTAPSAAGFYPLQFRMLQEWVEWFGDFTPTVNVEVRALRLEVIPVSRTTTTETVRVNAYDYTTGNPVQGTVTSSVTSPASTGTNITFTRPWVLDCYDGANGKVTCRREYLQVVFTVTAEGYGSASYWY